MIGLYLLAAHLLGDFVLQTRWQAVGKFTDSSLRMRHVWAYSIPFWPIAVVYDNGTRRHGLAFIVGLVLLHFLTDSRRFRSTLGDWAAYWVTAPEWNPAARIPPRTGSLWDMSEDELRAAMEESIYLPLPPNPWPAAPIMIDQALHVCQLALLGGLFLS